MSAAVYIKDDAIPWSHASTLEESFRSKIRGGKHDEVLAIIKHLPEKKKEKYRKIWLEEKEKLKNACK